MGFLQIDSIQPDTVDPMLSRRRPYGPILVVGVMALLFAIYWTVAHAPTPAQPTQQRTLADLAIIQPSLTPLEVLAMSDEGSVTHLIVTLTGKAARAPLGMTPATFVIDYRDQWQQAHNLPWQAISSAANDGDEWLESDEEIQLAIDLHTALAHPLMPGSHFAIDLRPTSQAMLTLAYTLPAPLPAQFQLQ